MNKKFIGDPGVRPGDPRVRLAAPVRAHGHHPQQPVLEPHQQLLPGRVVTAPRRSTRISVSDGFLLTLISSPVGKPSEMSESGDTGPGIFLINSIEPQEAGAEAVGCLMSGDEQSDKRNFIIRDR